MRVSRITQLTLVVIVFLIHFNLGHNREITVSAPSIESVNCGPMDVAFLVDTTTSMAEAINNVKSELSGILNNIEQASQNDYRLALVTFDTGITIKENFTANNRASIQADFESLYV